MSANTWGVNSMPVPVNWSVEVELGGGARLDADGGRGELRPRRDAQRGADHDRLAVIERGRREQAPRRVAADGAGRVADEDVDLARLEGRAALLGGQGAELDLRGVTQHGGRDGPAEVDIEAGVGAGALVERLKPGRAPLMPHTSESALLDGREDAGRDGRRGGRRGGRRSGRRGARRGGGRGGAGGAGRWPGRWPRRWPGRWPRRWPGRWPRRSRMGPGRRPGRRSARWP